MSDLGEARSLYRERASGMTVAAAPSVAFVVTNAVSSLPPAIVVASIVAVLAFAWQLHRRRPLWHAVIGLVVFGACAGIAAGTGQARGFFLLPMLVPFTVLALSVVSLLVGRPLTGLLLNRVSGGPPNWPEIPRLRHVYVVTTLATAAFQALNASVQVVLYLANETIALGGLHVLTGPASAIIVAATIVSARRVLRKDQPQPATATLLD